MLRFDAAPDELAVFLEEAEEQLQLLDQDVLILEKTGPNPDLLQEAFRAAHTLKGSSAAIGHERMASLTHAMESVLDCLRKEKIGVTTELVDLLLQSLDALRMLKEEVVTLTHSGLDPVALVSSLKRLLQDDPADAGRVQAKEAAGRVASMVSLGNAAANQPENGVTGERAAGPAYRITVTVQDDAMLPAARLLQARMALAEVSVLLDTSPSEEDLDGEVSIRQLTCLCISAKHKGQLESLLLEIPDIAAVEISNTDTIPESPGVDTADTADTPNADAEDDEASAAVESRPSPQSVASESADASESGDRRSGERTRDNKWASKTVRIDIERLDALMNLAGELVIDCTRLVQHSTRLQSRYEGEENVQVLSETSLHIERIADELQDQIMKARMLPIKSVFNRFPRMARDIARRAEKKIEFVIEGEETELDRSVIEEIGDPLIHLLRNAIDHGVETPAERLAWGKPESGLVLLTACHRENRIVLTVEDDGKGIHPGRIRESAIQKGLLTPESANRLSDREALELIFTPGFSTAREVSDLSGRGVGMDIVATNVRRLNGTVMVESEPGCGTRFTLELPLTLAIMEALLVSLGNAIFAIPLVSVIETLRVRSSEMKSINKENAIQLRGRVLPLLSLDTLAPRDARHRGAAKGHSIDQSTAQLAGAWGGPGTVQAEWEGEKARSSNQAWPVKDWTYVVVVGTENDKVGLVVDSLIGEQQVVIKSLGRYIGDIRGISGATILGDGSVALILDVGALVKKRLHEKAVELIYA